MRTVVIGLNMASADARKRLMDCASTNTLVNTSGNLLMAHLTQLIGMLKHKVSQTPSNIAVEGNLQQVTDFALNL